MEMKVGCKRYEARRCGALISRPSGFLSPQNAQTIEPNTAWAAVPYPSANTVYSTGTRPSAETMSEQW